MNSKEKKTVRLSDDTWEKLTVLKIKWKQKSLNDVLKILLEAKIDEKKYLNEDKKFK